MNFKRTALLFTLLSGSALFLGGCESECYEMTDGGSVGQNIQMWQEEDRINSTSLKPEFLSWWEKEKARWPVFKKKCVDAGTCYDQAAAAENENNAAGSVAQ